MTGKESSEPAVGIATPGADEEDLVNSGLEEAMVLAYRRIREIKQRLGAGVHLRTAAMVDAIDKIALAHAERAIFP